MKLNTERQITGEDILDFVAKYAPEQNCPTWEDYQTLFLLYLQRSAELPRLKFQKTK